MVLNDDKAQLDRIHANLAKGLDRWPGMRSDIEWLFEKFTELENAIAWDTSCLNCSRLLDASRKDYERAEKAEERLAKLREYSEGKIVMESVDETKEIW